MHKDSFDKVLLKYNKSDITFTNSSGRKWSAITRSAFREGTQLFVRTYAPNLHGEEAIAHAIRILRHSVNYSYGCWYTLLVKFEKDE